MLMYPDPPYLEIGFYFPQLSDDSSFIHLFNALVETGGDYEGVVSVNRGAKINQLPFSSVLGDKLVDVELRLESILESNLPDDIRLVRASFTRCFRASNDNPCVDHVGIGISL